MVHDRSHRHQRPDLSSGLPTTIHNPSTVEGQIEQAGKIAAGLRARRRGWRRIVFVAGTAVVVLGVLTVALLAALSGR